MISLEVDCEAAASHGSSISQGSSADSFLDKEDQEKALYSRLLVPNDEDEGDALKPERSISPSALSPSSSRSNIPSIFELLAFQATIMLIWCSEPCLSLMDTTVVGWTAPNATLQLAAMGPATTLMDTLLYMTYFLATGTTNQLAALLSEIKQQAESATTIQSSSASNSNNNATTSRIQLYRQLQGTTSRFMGLAVLAGSTVLLVIWTLGYFLLSQFTQDQELLNLALAYCRIRALMSPVAVLSMVLQSINLVTHQTHTVRRAMRAAVVSNCLADLLLTPVLGMKGAALATVAANGSEAMILLRRVYATMQEWKQEEHTLLEAQAEADVGFDDKVSPKGHATSSKLSERRRQLQEQYPPVPFLSLPDRSSFLHLLKLSLPLAFVMWARMGTYCTMTIRITRFGSVASLAAHNILVRVLYFLACVSDSLGQTAQTYLPATLYPKFVAKEYNQVWLRLSLLCLAASAAGGLAALTLLSKGSGLFVKDDHVAAILKSASPYVAGCLALHSFSTLIEGSMIAKRDFCNLIMTYGVTVSVYLYILSESDGLTSVWMSLVWWQALRIVNFNLWKRRAYGSNGGKSCCKRKPPLSGEGKPRCQDGDHRRWVRSACMPATMKPAGGLVLN
jgi:Na+-driven multidrug efflux pump